MAAFMVLAAVLITSASWFHSKWLSLFIVFSIAFTATYFVFYYLLEEFIYRKIKVIYKTISNFRSAKEKTLGKINLGDDIISSVSKEVKLKNSKRRRRSEKN